MIQFCYEPQTKKLGVLDLIMQPPCERIIGATLTL